jgi:hypothetical protein
MATSLSKLLCVAGPRLFGQGWNGIVTQLKSRKHRPDFLNGGGGDTALGRLTEANDTNEEL